MSAVVTLRLHPDAARNFDEKAERLLFLVAAVPVATQQRKGFQPDIQPIVELDEKNIIGEIKVGFVDYRGRDCGKTFEHDGKALGLLGQGFKDLETLAAHVQRTGEVYPYVSVRCLVESGFQWVEKRYRRETDESFTGFVLRECAKLIKDLEIWLPISRVYLQADLVVGRVTFKTLTRQMLDAWMEQTTKNLTAEQGAGVNESFRRTRSRLQGCAAATIALTAEPVRGQEIASQEAEQSIAALRFFHEANLSPYFRSYCAVSGTESASHTTAVWVQSGRIERWADDATSTPGSAWVLSGHSIRAYQQAGLSSLSQLLLKDKRSTFQSELLDAILIYSRNSLFDDPANRLIYILAAVESILLRSDTEPIQKSIGERLAFIVGPTARERILIRDNVTQVYGFRSKFLHHGRPLAEMDALEVFMKHVWMGFVELINRMDDFGTKADLIEALERRKME